MTEKKPKTFKREVACVMLLGLGWLAYTGDNEMVNTLVWPVIGFATAAFGLDAVAKQWTR